MSELKACPFCGGTAKIDLQKLRTTPIYCAVVCSNCGNTTQYYKQWQTAIEKWNSRKADNPFGVTTALL